MSQRFYKRIRAGFGPYTLLGFWVSGKKNYAHFGIEMPGLKKRNVHLTIGCKNDIIDCHVADYDYNKGTRIYPWRADPLPIKELEPLLEEVSEPLICDYAEDDEYEELDLSPWTRYVDDLDWEGRKVAKFDFLPIFQKAISGTLLTRRRIIDGFIDGNKPGMLMDQEYPVFVIPYEEGQMLKLDFGPDNPLFNKLPYMGGFEAYMEYVDSEGLMEEYFERNMPPVEEIEAAIMGIISKETENRD